MWKPLNLLYRTILQHNQTWEELQRIRKFSRILSLHQNWKQPIGHDTGILIYNTLAKEKVPLILQNDKILNWYACGPTVYDSAHIGHASSYVRQDVIRRIFRTAFGIDCVFVLGMTDVDDKIIARSKEMNKTITEMTSFYEEEFLSDMSRLNILPPRVITRVTENIPVIIAFIQGLENKGFAYKSNGSVYFDVNKYGRYGVFSNPQEEQVGVDGKKISKDFALWKGNKPGEPSWDSPWGKGRPGWHIECSAMASSLMGSTIDLHSGGEDLIFPHHENELAQSCCFHNTTQWINYWFHTGKLYLSGQDEKMSKSLKNFITVGTFLESYTSNHFRMLCLLTHYRKRIDFNDERMDKAVSTVNSFNNFIQKCEAYVNGQIATGGLVPESELYERLEAAKMNVLQAYADDFNTPKALAIMMRLIKFASQAFRNSDDEEYTTSTSNVSHVRSPAVMSALSLFIQRHLDLLGIKLGQKKSDSISSKLEMQFNDVIDLTVSSRNKIRNLAKDKKHFFDIAEELDIPKEKAAILMKKAYSSLWNVSDEIRVQLLKRADVELQDTKDGTSWSTVEPMKNKILLQPNKKEAKKNISK